MAKGLAVSYIMGTRFEEYTGTIKEAEHALAVCGNVFVAAKEACSCGFVPVSHVAYDFAKREIGIHFANSEVLSKEIYLEGDINVFSATRSILQELLFPALTTSKFVEE